MASMSKCVMFVAAVATVLSVDGTSAMKLSLDSRMVVKGAVDHDHAHEHDPTSAAAEAAKESITEHKPTGDHDADPNEVETHDPKKKTEDEKTVSKNNTTDSKKNKKNDKKGLRGAQMVVIELDNDRTAHANNDDEENRVFAQRRAARMAAALLISFVLMLIFLMTFRFLLSALSGPKMRVPQNVHYHF